MRSQKLKLGLFLDSFLVPAWLFYSLERILNSNYAQFLVIIINEAGQKGDVEAGLSRIWENKSEVAYQIFNKIDEKLFLRQPNAFTLMDLKKIFSNVPLVSVGPVGEDDTDVFKPEDVEKIRNFGLDIIIKMGFRQLRGEILSTAKYGVWFYDHCDNRVIRGEPPGFWEVVESRPETGVVLSIANENPQMGQAVYRSRFLTYPFSPARNRNVQFWVSSSFLPRQIELLYDLGEVDFYKEIARYNCEFDFYDHKQYQIPSNLAALRLYTRLLFKQLVEIYERFSSLDTWYLMFKFTEDTSHSFGTFNKMMPPKDRFWADPQVIKKDGNLYIFVEEYFYKNGKGHLSVFEMNPLGQYKDPVPVIIKDYHLSYPFIFEYQNKYYMIPETAQNKTIDLYECVDFPTGWKFKMTLMKNVIAVDTTLFFYENKWWLFTGLAENEGAFPEVELFLFYSDELFTTEWISHPFNPVISDVTSARPAGKMFIKNGKIYRPSQDCSKVYGHGFNINEVLCLSETKYLEKKIAEVKPNWDSNLIGTHTYTNTETFVIIDGLTRRSKFF
jgi:hypothetical protein